MDTLGDGERVMALQIEQVTVVAKMRSIPERNGRVVLDFIVTLPKQLLGKSRSVVITPILHKPDESVALEDLMIRGGRFSLLQERDYWQYETYVERFRPDTVGREAAFNRFVKFPYPEDVRLDSLVEGRSTVTYYYSQEVKTDETSKKMLVTLQGQVLAVDDSAYRLPPSDTLSYVVSSMLSFVDTMPRYRIKVIDKFVPAGGVIPFRKGRPAASISMAMAQGSAAFTRSIFCRTASRLLGEHSDLHFFDAAAPLVSAESVDMNYAWMGSRYDKGTDDYVNCPMNQEEYDAFWQELTHAQEAE